MISRENINSDELTSYCLKVGDICKKKELDLVVGGGVSSDALDTLKKISNNYLTRFETRKIIFSSESLSRKDIDKGLLTAVEFELLWLINKREYYSMITSEDEKRIDMLESRWKVLSS